MTELRCFEPQSPPETLQELYGELKHQHYIRPFEVDPRTTLGRVQNVAGVLGFEPPQKFVGTVEIAGVSVNHVWGVYEDVVLDMSYPVLNKDFQEALRLFVMGDISHEELISTALQAAFSERLPSKSQNESTRNKVKYIGQLVWKARHK